MTVKRRNTTVIHYDPLWADRGLCGVSIERNAPLVLTSDKTKVTCGACIRQMWQAMEPLPCRTCGGTGEHDWEIHDAERRASERD